MKTKYKAYSKREIRAFVGMTIILLALALTLGSCKKYLDVKKNASQNFIETAADCQLILDNYADMNTNYPSDGQASSDDYYLGPNAYPGTLTQENKSIYTWQPSAIRESADPQWRRPYFTVYQANLILEVLEDIKSSTNITIWNNLRGSALFFRAYAFWNIAQLYCKPYGSTATQDPGIPLRLSSDINDKSERGTVEQTYAKIIQDLQEAVNLLNATSSIATRPNKASAYAMLARVYLSMEDYPNTLTNANASILLRLQLLDYNSSTINKSTTSTVPIPQFNTEVLFHSIISTVPLLAPGNATTPTARINPDLYNLYDTNDWRKLVFFKANSGTYAGTYRFTGNYAQVNSATLFNGLTIGEMYLTRAECYARSNKLPEALSDINTLLSNRYITGTFIPLSVVNPAYDTADEVLSKVLVERRKELVMRAQRWTDLRRLNKDVRFKVDQTRTVTEGNPAVTTTYSLPANDIRYTLLIPLEQITNSTIPQNPR